MSYGDYIRERIAHTQKLRFIEGNPLYITKCKEKPFKAFTLYGNAEGVENPEIVVCGKNLIPFPYPNDTDEYNGVKFTKNDDGTILANGVCGEGGISFPLVKTDTYPMFMPKGCSFRLSGGAKASSTKEFRTYLQYYSGTGKNVITVNDYGTTNGVTSTPSENSVLKAIAIVINEGATLNNVTFMPQLEIGETSTDFEMYKTPQKVALPYTFAENDYLTLLNKKVKTFINGVQTDITDSEVGQAILNLECFEPTTTILCNSETQPNNMYIKYISK